MTQKEKDLLLKDLSGRLFYGVKYTIYDDKTGNTAETLLDIRTSIENEIEIDLHSIEDVKPYLRPLSSITEEERIESLNYAWTDDYGRLASYDENISKYIDWLNAHHFDFRNLIEKGLALEAPEGMYKTE